MLILLSSFTSAGYAQLYNNEWIDYNKVYHKFKVGQFGYDNTLLSPIRKGLVRITQPALAAAGLGNTASQDFQLIRDGEEVTIFISTATGILSATDYIEFWGEMANGKTDKALYRDSTFQLSDHWNLQTDSATYFLTVNTGGNNKRFVQTANDISTASIAPEKNFMFTTGKYFRDTINYGYGFFREQRLYSSSYDLGEGFTSRSVKNYNPLTQTFSKLYADTTGADVTLKLSMVGNWPAPRDVKILLNNDSLTQFPMGYFQSKISITDGIAANRLKTDTAKLTVQNYADLTENEMRIASIELKYPRLFNFGAATSFEFEIAASDTGRYLQITNFNRGANNAVLYDVTNGKKYTADTSLTGTVQFLLLPSSVAYHLVLAKANDAAALSIGTLQQTQMINFAEATNQGNYLIIFNPLLYGSGSANYVQQYSDYRSSDSGGHFNAKVIDIHQLEDQFAFGVSMHPLAIKNFLRYARTNFTEKPANIFLIGKAVAYTAYRLDKSTNPLTAKINLVPVFGSPGSDNLLSSDNYDPVAATPIGRLSAVSAAEVGTYLEKIKQYESAQRNSSQTLEDKIWMKKILQLSGTTDVSLAAVIDSAQAGYKKIISDTLYGGDVKTYSRTIDPGAYPELLLNFTNEYNKGSAILEYFGHSSSTGIDFNLDNPANYSNAGKYPLFIVNGCLAGNIFDYDINRLNNRSTLSEKFVLEPQRGAIGYLSSSSFGVVTYLDIFTKAFYTSIAGAQYGKGFGQVMPDALANGFNYTGHSDFYGRMHAEQFTFHGDPALVINSFTLPDYIVDSSEINISPSYLTVADDSFTVKCTIHNLGKANNDSIQFFLLRKSPAGNTDTAYNTKLPAVKSLDSVTIKLPIVGNRDKGKTVLTAVIDDDNSFAELSENNNASSVSITISAADLLPVSPYNYAVVTQNSVDLIASTVYAFDSAAQYIMELDTTALFNSPLKTARYIVAPGGLVEFKNIPLQLNNTVYYWRVAEDSSGNHWNNFSFIKRNPGNSGFEQAHFYQHTQSVLKGLTVDTLSRSFKFASSFSNLFIQHSIYPTSGTEDAQFSMQLNGNLLSASACTGSSIIFNIFDPVTFKPVPNTTFPYNAATACKPFTEYNFEYSTQSATTRKNAMDFLDSYVQNGYYVVARKIYDIGNADWAPTVWAKDTALYGHNNSLYHRLKSQGTQIDSFTYPRTFIFVFKKNDSTDYKPVSILSKGLYDRISLSQNIAVSDTLGTITSPQFGPGKSWSKVKWSGLSANNNITSLDIIGSDSTGKDSVFYTIDTSLHELNISAINAVAYPYLQLRMHTQDSITYIPYQLQDWSVEFEPVPEGAIDAGSTSSIPDTLFFDHQTNTVYDTLQGYAVFKNISNTAFTPLKIKMILYDADNNPHNYILPVTNPLPAGDTLHVSFKVNITDLPAGTYNLYLEVNPENDQPEQYHFNNFLYKYIVIQREIVLPVKLVSFQAKPAGASVLLNWNIANESNIANYAVEFSSDGRRFSTIGNVKPSNANTIIKTYSFLHTKPVNGKNYYRIKMVDKDGKFSYSSIRSVTFSNSDIAVYPNPFKNQLTVTMAGGNAGQCILRLLDVTGKQLFMQKFNSSVTLNVGKLAGGMYIIQVNNSENILSYKVYKE